MFDVFFVIFISLVVTCFMTCATLCLSAHWKRKEASRGALCCQQTGLFQPLCKGKTPIQCFCTLVPADRRLHREMKGAVFAEVQRESSWSVWKLLPWNSSCVLGWNEATLEDNPQQSSGCVLQEHNCMRVAASHPFSTWAESNLQTVECE